MNGIVRRVDNDLSYGTSVNNIYKMISFKAPEGDNARILRKKDPFKYNSNIIIVGKGSMFLMTSPDDVNKFAFFETIQDVELNITAAVGTDGDCADGTINSRSYNEQGVDYFVYLVWDPTLNNNAGGPKFVISKKEIPEITAGTPYEIYKLIGGFHVGTVRRTNSANTGYIDGYNKGNNKALVGGVPINGSSVEFGDGWITNVLHKQILHNSVWDLDFRPKTRGVGFAYTRAGVWESIYQIGDDKKSKGQTPNTIVNRDNSAVSSNSKYLKSLGPTPVSKYGMVPLTGSEGTSHVVAVQLAHQLGGCRLPSYDEWIQGAYGSPQATSSGNDNAWANASARHTTGCAVDQSGNFTEASGNVLYAVSADNITQCVGNIWEYLSDITFDYLTTYESVGSTVTSWEWCKKTSVIEGDFYGNVRTGRAGGFWIYSTHCGGFTFDGYNSVLAVNGSGGVRLVSDTE